MRTVLSYCHTCHWWQVPVSSVKVLDCSRIADLDCLNLSPCPRRCATPVPFQNSYRVTNEPLVPSCCSPNVKVLGSLTPYRT